MGVRVIFGYKTIINSMYFSLRSFRSVVVQALILFKLLTHLFVHFSLRLFFFSEIFFRFSNQRMLLCVY